MNLSLHSFIKAITLTQTVVKLNNANQAPINVAGTETIFLSFPWFDEEASDICDIMDTDIWNLAGRSCSLFAETSCIKRDICKAINPLLSSAVAPQAKACLARYKTRLLRKDLVDICSEPVPPPPVVGPVAVNESQPMPVRVAAAGVANPADGNAYNVVTIAQSNPSSVEFGTIALSGWADKTPSLFVASKRISPEQLSSIQGSLDNRLATISSQAAKRTFTTAQREILVARAADGGVPFHTAPSPFGIDVGGRSFTLRNLPSSNAGSIATFAGDQVAAEIDCYTIPCTNGWIGMRVVKDKAIFRGWVSADELATVAKPGVSIEIKYDGKRVAPRAESVEAIRRAIRPNASTPPASGRIQVMAVRSLAEDSASVFLAGARLSFLDGLLIDLGVSSNDIVKTVADAPSLSQLPAAVINLGPGFSPSVQH